MKILLDTCTFLWLSLDDHHLSSTARQVFIDPENEIYLSVISSWEIAVKYGAKKLPLPEDPGEWVPQSREARGLLSLPLTEDVTLYVSKLPRTHGDPFDRMLICQAIVHGLTILTPDPHIRKYPIRTLW